MYFISGNYFAFLRGELLFSFFYLFCREFDGISSHRIAANKSYRMTCVIPEDNRKLRTELRTGKDEGEKEKIILFCFYFAFILLLFQKNFFVYFICDKICAVVIGSVARFYFYKFSYVRVKNLFIRRANFLKRRLCFINFMFLFLEFIL